MHWPEWLGGTDACLPIDLLNRHPGTSLKGHIQHYTPVIPGAAHNKACNDAVLTKLMNEQVSLMFHSLRNVCLCSNLPLTGGITPSQSALKLSSLPRMNKDQTQAEDKYISVATPHTQRNPDTPPPASTPAAARHDLMPRAESNVVELTCMEAGVRTHSPPRFQSKGGLTRSLPVTRFPITPTAMPQQLVRPSSFPASTGATSCTYSMSRVCTVDCMSMTAHASGSTDAASSVVASTTDCVHGNVR